MEPFKDPTFTPSAPPAQEHDLSPSGQNDPLRHAVPLRTLSSDLAEAVREQQGSAIKIAIAEDERRARDREASSPTSKRNLSLLVGGALCILAAIGAVSGVLWYRAKQAAAVPVMPTSVAASIVRSDATGTMDITGQTGSEIANQFRGIVANPGIPIGAVKDVEVTEGSNGAAPTRVPANLFLAAIGAHVTPEFSRALSQDYMLGMYSYDHTNPFLVLTGTAHDYLLSGMLAWEPYMLQDLAPLFGIDTTGTNTSLLSASFADTLIENRSTRAINDASGKPVLFYTFLDDDTIFIAADGQTLTEAVRRLHQ